MKNSKSRQVTTFFDITRNKIVIRVGSSTLRLKEVESVLIIEKLAYWLSSYRKGES